jgi:ribosomal protein S18 acetylase RimI-like enzyme
VSISIKKVKEKEIASFAKREWGTVYKRFGFVPAPRDFFFGIFEDKKLRGYGKMYLMGKVAEVTHLMIQDKFTGKGFGGRLMVYMEEWAKKRKCTRLVLETPAIFKDTVNFYKKYGFKIISVLPKYFYGRSWYYMGKDLK